MSAPDAEDGAVVGLVHAARAFAALRPRKNPTAIYAVRLDQLVQAARATAARTDEQWAAEVAGLKETLEEIQTIAAGQGDDRDRRLEYVQHGLLLIHRLATAALGDGDPPP